MSQCITAHFLNLPLFSVGQDRAIMTVWCSGRSFPAVVAEFRNLAKDFERPFDDVARRVSFLISHEAFQMGRVDPIQRALYTLGKRASRAPTTPGGFNLDGKSVRAIDVINAANKILLMIGEVEIDYPLIEIKGAA